MKVAFYPNICNNNYPIIKALREFANIDAHLYIADHADIQNLPETEDESLVNNYPNWIHKSSKWSVSEYLKTKDKTFINELNKYDIVFLSDLGVILAPYLNGKTIFLVTGGDLTRVPFPSKFKSESNGIVDYIKKTYIGYLQRKGMKHLDEIWTQKFSPFVNALKQLNIPNEKIKDAYFKVFVNTNIIKPNKNYQQGLDTETQAKLKKFDFKIFHPSRLMITQTKGLVESGQWKGNDVLFRAFAKLLNRNLNACLILIDRTFGGEVEIAKKIIAELGIEKNIIWLKPPNKQGFTKLELVNLYNASDVVVDEFGIGWFGSIVVEGLACGKPVFCYLDEVAMKGLYDWHPIISVNNENDIANEFYKLHTDKNYMQQKEADGLNWIAQYHTFEISGKSIADKIKELVK